MATSNPSYQFLPYPGKGGNERLIIKSREKEKSDLLGLTDASAWEMRLSDLSRAKWVEQVGWEPRETNEAHE